MNNGGTNHTEDLCPLTRKERADAVIIRTFPYIVVISLILMLIIGFRIGAGTIGAWLLSAALGFLILFAIFGIYCIFTCDKSTLHPIKWVPLLFVVPPVFAILMYVIGDNFYPPLLTSKLFELNVWFGFEFANEIGLLTFRLYVMMVATFLVAHGVMSTISAHFRKYMPRVYGYVEKLRNDGTDTRGGKFILWVYKIPSVIDVKSVEVREELYENNFDTKAFTSLLLSVYVFGVVVSSYIFLNPVLTEGLSFSQVMVTAMALSSFMPALVIPWYNAKDTEVRIKSQARDYFLWEGMKQTLYTGFFAFGLLFFLFILLLYYGADLERVVVSYVGYLIFMGFTSTIVSFVYTNHYRVGMNNGIIGRFGKRT